MTITILIAGIALIAFSGALGFVVGKIYGNRFKDAETGEYGVLRGCYNCRFYDRYEDEEPCDDCGDWSNWEAEDESMDTIDNSCGSDYMG